METSDPRVLRTRRLLEDALLSFASERPYATVTVKDIAARATVNRATFYAHFADKDDLLRGLLRSRLDQALSVRLEGDDSGDGPASFEAYLDALLPAALEFSEWAAGGCRSARQQGLDAALPEAELRARIETLVGQWLGVGEDDGAAEMTASAVAAMVARVSTDWSRRAERVPEGTVLDRLRSLVLGAVGALPDAVDGPARARG
ncbi:hypothetical protein B1759_03175 [Rubrivirga sp. SAORIC476]|nr:hypothetical protein B1759_03175 [Rubrivirga sp. SAORIC476]